MLVWSFFCNKLNKIKIKDDTILLILKYLDLNNNNEYNFLKSISKDEYNNLINFINDTIYNIIKLKCDIPNYSNTSKNELKLICDEYYKFHNNIITNIKKFITYYTDYYNKIKDLYDRLLKNKYNPLFQQYEILISNYNGNSVCRQDPNFPMRKNDFENKINEIKLFLNYILNECDNILQIKNETKNIDTKFLVLLKKTSYKKK